MEITIALSNYPISQFNELADWRAHTEKWVTEALNQGAQVLVFPEYGSMELTSLLPLTIQHDLKQQLHAMQAYLPHFKNWFQDLSKRHTCTIVAPSYPEWTGHLFVNRTYVFHSGEIAFQDKHFMTRFEDETWGISSSSKPLTLFKTPHGNFGIQLCFDIEFPIGTHLLAAAGAEYILVPSCTETLKGATRVHVGARARAMEQQLYVGVSQTVGEALWSPAVDLNFGYTAFYSSPDGDFDSEGILSKSNYNEPGWLIRTIDLSQNTVLREEGQVLNYKHSQRQQMTQGNMHVVEQTLGITSSLPNIFA